MVLTVGGLVRRVLLPPLAATAAPIDARLVLLTVGICGGRRARPRSGAGDSPVGDCGSQRPVLATAARRHRGLIDTFVGLQVALSVPLLVGTGLFTVSLWKALHVDFGQETDHTTVVRADFADDGRPEEAHAAHRRIQAHLQTLPGVTAVAMVQGAPSGRRLCHGGVAGVGPTQQRGRADGERRRIRHISQHWGYALRRDARSVMPTIDRPLRVSRS